MKTLSLVDRIITILSAAAREVKVAVLAVVAAEAVRHAIADQVDVLAVAAQQDEMVNQIVVVKVRLVVVVAPQHQPILNPLLKSTFIHRTKPSKR